MRSWDFGVQDRAVGSIGRPQDRQTDVLRPPPPIPFRCSGGCDPIAQGPASIRRLACPGRRYSNTCCVPDSCPATDPAAPPGGCASRHVLGTPVRGAGHSRAQAPSIVGRLLVAPQGGQRLGLGPRRVGHLPGRGLGIRGGITLRKESRPGFSGAVSQLGWCPRNSPTSLPQAVFAIGSRATSRGPRAAE
jgi:hypothetical protein